MRNGEGSFEKEHEIVILTFGWLNIVKDVSQYKVLSILFRVSLFALNWLNINIISNLLSIIDHLGGNVAIFGG